MSISALGARLSAWTRSQPAAAPAARPMASLDQLSLTGAGVPQATYHLLSWHILARANASAPARGGFADTAPGVDTQRWRKCGPWRNGDSFDCVWAPGNIQRRDGQTILSITNTPGLGAPYSGAELATHEKHRYGRYEAVIKPARQAGVITSLFTYTGPKDGTPHDEIDIEFLGHDTTRVQLGYFTGGRHYATEFIELGFDASEGFHTYAFDWSPTGIRWYVDGKLVKTATAQDGPLPSHPGKLMVNVWPTVGVDKWAGRFVYPGRPVEAAYTAIRHTPA